MSGRSTTGPTRSVSGTSACRASSATTGDDPRGAAACGGRLSDRRARMYAGERSNALTHGVGSLLALVGSGALVVAAARSGDPWKVVGVSVYGMTLVLLYGT